MNAYSTDFHGCRTGRMRTREERNPSNLHGWLTRDEDQTSWDFIISNLSYGGCRIRTAAPLLKGEHIRLFVTERGLIESTVIWRRGEEAGLAFAVEPKNALWPRRAVRYNTRVPVLVRRQGRAKQRIDALDISQVGCRLEFVSPPREGDLVWVQLRGLETLPAEVRWVEGHQAGVLFGRPINSIVFRLLMDQWRTAGAIY